MRRIIRGSGPDGQAVEDHPDTGRRLQHITLPKCDADKLLSEAAASIVADRRPGRRHHRPRPGGRPVLVEVHAGGDMDRTQLAGGTGVPDQRFAAFPDQVGRYQTRFAC